MRFRNSSHYFGRETHAQRQITPNPATGKAFRVTKEHDARPGNSFPRVDSSVAPKSPPIVTEAIVRETQPEIHCWEVRHM
jgi:hypothetical protein